MSHADLVKSIPLPVRMQRLPRHSTLGYVVPWFVAENEGSRDDFRFADSDKRIQAVRDQLCWVCGQRLGKFKSFVIGPMCLVNLTTSEPPCHRDCAEYSAKACPFLVRPEMVRRKVADTIDDVPAAGIPLDRNPGVAVVLTTTRFRTFRTYDGNAGWLIRMLLPYESLSWWHQGRLATPAAARYSLESGIGALRDEAAKDEDPAGALQQLEEQYQLALTWAPTAAAA